MPRLARLASLLLTAAGRRSATAGCGNKEERPRVGETEGIYVTRRRPQVPGPDLAHPQPGAPEDAALPARPARGRGASRRPGRGLVRHLHARRERDRRAARDGRASSRSSTRRTRSSSRSTLDPDDQPLRLRAAAESRPATAAARAQLARLGQHDPGRAAALQAHDRVAQQPPARARDREPERRRRTPSSTSTSSGAPAPPRAPCRAAGAAVSPPAPCPTSSTATATRGRAAGA